MPELRLFSTKPYDRVGFDRVDSPVERVYLEPRLALDTVGLADGAPAVCVFVNDDVSAPVIEAASEQPARVSGIRTVFSGARILDVSAMKCTPA